MNIPSYDVIQAKFVLFTKAKTAMAKLSQRAHSNTVSKNDINQTASLRLCICAARAESNYLMLSLEKEPGFLLN